MIPTTTDAAPSPRMYAVTAFIGMLIYNPTRNESGRIVEMTADECVYHVVGGDSRRLVKRRAPWSQITAMLVEPKIDDAFGEQLVEHYADPFYLLQNELLKFAKRIDEALSRFDDAEVEHARDKVGEQLGDAFNTLDNLSSDTREKWLFGRLVEHEPSDEPEVRVAC